MTAAVAVSLRRGVPLTGFHRAIYASQRLHPDSPLHNMALLSHLDGVVDPDRLQRAFADVVRRHGALRSVVEVVDGVPRLVPGGGRPFTEVLELSRDATAAWATERVARPVDITRTMFDSALVRHPDGTSSWYLCMHHLATDATSSARVFAETAARYAALADEAPEATTVDDATNEADAGTSEADGDSADGYLSWLAALDRSGGARIQAARAHWASVGSRVPLGALYRRVERPTTAADRYPIPLDADLAADLDAALTGRLRLVSPDLSWTALLLTVTALYLSKLSGRPDVAIGVPVHNRSSAGTRDLVGLVMEVFPVVVEVADDDTAASLHRRVSRSLFETVRHAVPGTAPAQQVDAVVNVIRRAGLGDFGEIAARTDWVHAGACEAGHLVRVQCTAYDSEPSEIALDVNHGGAGPDQRARAAGHVRTLLAWCVRNPDAPVARAPLVGDDELALLTAWGDGGPVDEPERTVVAALERALSARADVALVDGDHRLTGAELWRWVEGVAAWLRAMGARPGTRVGVCLPRSAEAVAALLAVLRSGASYVVLDPAHPEMRRSRLAARAGCLTVVDRVPTSEELAAAATSLAAGEPATLDDEAYVLYTSGSTGEPKAVPISHRGLALYLEFAVRSYFSALGAPPVAPLFSALGFDLTVTTLFGPLLAGGVVDVVREEGPAAVAAVAERTHLTWMKATPSHLELLVRTAPEGHGVRTFVVGGENFPTRLAVALAERFPGARVFNEYGPTEAVVGCMIHEWRPGDRYTVEASVPIGRPAPGVHLAVVDRFGEPVPLGATGELWIASPGLTAGYLDDDALNLARFAHRPEGRFYRSGDVARLLDEQTATYGGRVDDQIKVGGVRLEPAEVEAALEAHPGVARAAVRLWSPARRRRSVQRCTRCGLPDDVPGVAFDVEGVCSTCRAYDEVAPQAAAWFRSPADLDALRERARRERRGRFDAVHLLSGGKDSTYALYQLVERGFEVMAVTLDNGFISDGAKANIGRSIADLGIEHRYVSTEHMDAIFRDSLERYSNVCNGCYKTIYTLGVQVAEEVGAPLLITGLSRGQLFETRLMPGQFRSDRFDPDAIDRAVLEARKSYHRAGDAPNRLLDTSAFQDDALFERVTFVDIYRYLDVELAEMLEFLATRAPWVRPADTGRSTNCLVNAAGIHTHTLEQGYHNYAVPYAWDVRLGHKTRDEAIEELDDEIDLDSVTAMLLRIGYAPRPRTVLTAWFEPSPDAPAVTPAQLRQHLAARLPAAAVPSAFVQVVSLPHSTNGKLDVDQLPPPERVHRPTTVSIDAADTATEQLLVELWERVLGVEPVGALDHFFDLGGDSLGAIEVALSAGERLGVRVPEELVFAHPQLRELARVIDELHLLPAAVEEPVAVTAAPDEPPPLSAGERSLLFEARTVAATRYRLARLYTLGTPVDPARLAAAATTVATRHEPLHWTFGDPRQQLAPEEAVSVATVEVADEAEARERALGLQARGVDIDRGPLLALEHYRWAGGEAVAVVVHHLSADDGSFDLLWRDIMRLLDGDDLPPVVRGMGDVVRDQLRHPPDALGQHWADLLAEPAAEPLGRLARPAPGPDGYVERAASVPAAALRHGGRSAAAPTPFAAALAGLGVVLRRYGADDRFIVGLTTSQRPPGATDLIGYFLNVVPMPVMVGSDDRLGDVAQRAGQWVADAVAGRMYPLSRIVHDARTAGRPDPTPTVLLAFMDHAEPSGRTLAVRDEILWGGSAVMGATVFVQLRGDTAHLGIEYRGDLLDESTARRLLDDLDAALHHLVHEPDTTVGRLALPSLRGSVLEGGPLAGAEPVRAAVTRWGEATPQAVALVVGERTVTYRDLVAAAGDIAGRLRAAGVVPGGRVGVVAHRDPNTIAAFLAAWTIEASYVPLDPTVPSARRAAMLQQVGATVLVDGHEVQGLGPPSGAVAPGEAYVLFTSGSTGSPRGVSVSHENLAASTAARHGYYGGAPSPFLVVSALGFDSSVAGLYGTLTGGGTVVLPADRSAADVDALVGIVGRHEVAATLMVPTLYAAVLERGARSAHWPSTVIVAGEASPAALVRAHFAARPSSALHNEYGPTEATVWSSVHRCAPDDDPVPIGGPIPGTTLVVADERGNPVPEGAAGELLVMGRGVATGYVADPVATAERFVPGLARQRAYRTGDRVRARDGVLLFEGRFDDQLSVGGVRVEPVEIETVLERCPGVRTAAVTVALRGGLDTALAAMTPASQADILAAAARGADPLAELRRLVVAGDRSAVLVAHLEVDPESPPDATVLRLALETLPSAYRPRRVGRVDALPRTERGKLDRAGLLGRWPETDLLHPAVGGGSGSVVHEPAGAPTPDAGGGGAPPALVALVSSVVAEVLGRDIGPDDDFFSEGGDSLGALTTVARLEDRLGRPVMMTDLIEAPTVRGLAARLAEGDTAPGHASSGADGEPVAAATPATGVATVAALGHPLVEWAWGDPTDRTTPLVMMFAHGGGHLMGYRALFDGLRARGLPNAVVGFRLPGLDGRTRVAYTIESQVDAFFEPLLELHGDRPCLLVGGSSGGLLAWEAGQRLRARGFRADVVMCMDTVHPDAMREDRASRFGKYRAIVRRDGLGAAVREFGVVVQRRRRRTVERMARAVAERPVVPGTAGQASFIVEDSVDRAVMAYHPSSADTPVVFLAASQTDRRHTLDRWAPVMANLTVVPVEGAHSGAESIGAPHRVHQWVDAIVAVLATIG